MSLKTTLTGAFMALAFATPALAEIEISNPYARSSNPMAGAAFMLIHNSGDTDDRLIGVMSDVSARTELHTHEEDDDGVMRMIHVEEGFDLPAGGDISMQRGAEHVMFMGLNAPFEQDDTVTITFIFEVAGEMTVEIPVDQTRDEMDATGDTGDMDDMGDMMDDMDHGDMDGAEMDGAEMDHGTDG